VLTTWSRRAAPQVISGSWAPPEIAWRARWAVVVDALLMASVAVFAWWTLIYEVVLVFKASTTPAVIVWLVTSPVVGFVIGRATVRASVDPVQRDRTSAESTGPATLGAGRPRHPRLAITALLVAASASAAVLATQKGAAFTAAWAVALLVALTVAGRTVRSVWTARTAVPPDSDDGSRETPRPSRLYEFPALVVSVLMAAVSLFVIRTSSDDAYYVNLSTWVAEHGHIPLRDTMYGNQVYPSSYGGGIPIASIEGLIGAIARVTHLLTGTVAYLVVVPLCTFASIWVLWRLTSLWSPRRPIASFLFAVTFLVAGTGGAYRSYSYVRIWQGKVIALAVLVPLIWWLATKLAESSQRHWIVMLAISGIAFVGLTTSSALLGSLVAGCIVCTGIVTGNRALLRGGIACGIPVVISGLVLAVFSSNIGGAAPIAPTRWKALHAAFGAHPAMVALTIVVILLAPLVVTRRIAAPLMSGMAVLCLTILTPGLFLLINAVTGAGPVEWRLLLGAPVPALVGICAATLLSLAVRLVPRCAPWIVMAVVGAMVVTAFALVGTPPWQASIRFEHRPAWKLSPTALANVKAVVASVPDANGPILLPAVEMRVLAIYTTRWYAVVPRAFDLRGLPEPATTTLARRTLLALVSRTAPRPSAPSVREALRTLHVGTVCVHPSDTYARRTVRAAGYSPFQPVGALRCSRLLP
jgi:hypothetical protein